MVRELLLSILLLSMFSFRFYAEEIKITSVPPVDGAWLGFSVAIDNNFLVIGAPKENNDSGEIYIFERDQMSGNWQQIANFAGAAGSGAQLGNFVTIRGNIIVAGAEYIFNRQGRAYVFSYDGQDWTPIDTLVSSDVADGDRFGCSISVYGDYIISGAYQDDDGGESSGSAYIFTRSGDDWIQQQKLTADDATTSDFFGYSVSIGNSYAVIGAFGTDDLGDQSGAAYIFERSGTVWTQQTRIIPDEFGPSNMGKSVSISGLKVALGAPFDHSGDFNFTGATYIYSYSGASWIVEEKILASNGELNDFFGESVSLDGDYLLVGAPGSDQDPTIGPFEVGSIYSYLFRQGTWDERANIVASDAGAGDNFGRSVFIDSVYSIAGSPYNDYSGLTNPGAAYVYETVNDLSLPVQLSSFSSRYYNNSVVLQWSTQSEINNVGFEILRTNHYMGNFQIISSYLYNSALKGQMNSNTLQSYEYHDQDIKPDQTYYYKLVDIDIFGNRVEYGPIQIKIPSVLDEFILFSAYPNPFNPVTNIRIHIPGGLNEKTVFELAIFNVLGEKIKTIYHEKLNSNDNLFSWSATNQNGNRVASGLYYIILSSSDAYKVVPVIYQK